MGDKDNRRARRPSSAADKVGQARTMTRSATKPLVVGAVLQ